MVAMVEAFAFNKSRVIPTGMATKYLSSLMAGLHLATFAAGHLGLDLDLGEVGSDLRGVKYLLTSLKET